ncbi:MAG: hypothetical protein ACKV1O_16875 [Saprospiraceae bacterium]
MSLNFLVTNCQEDARKDLVFGLCDNQDGKKAYSNTDAPANWIATVKNDHAIELVFTPIDKCIIHDHEYAGRGRCDGMLTSSEHLFFVELKNEPKGWITGAIEQLESTIEFFKENHDINAFRHKKAFACNKKHRHFQEIDNELNLAFFRKHKVRIDIQAEIIVV